MNQKQAKQSWKTAYNFALKKRPQLAEDFAQEYIVSQLKGWKQSVRQAWTDFIRKERGDIRTAVGRMKADCINIDNSLDRYVIHENQTSLLHNYFISPDNYKHEQLHEIKIDLIIRLKHLWI